MPSLCSCRCAVARSTEVSTNASSMGASLPRYRRARISERRRHRRLTGRLTRGLTHSRTHSLTRELTHGLTHSLANSLSGSLRRRRGLSEPGGGSLRRLSESAPGSLRRQSESGPGSLPLQNPRQSLWRTFPKKQKKKSRGTYRSTSRCTVPSDKTLNSFDTHSNSPRPPAT